MNQNAVLSLFERHKLKPDRIAYIYRKDQKTCIQLKNGATIDTYIPVKDIFSQLPSNGDFLSINKGVVISQSYLLVVENGMYYMMDGMSFRGRVRTPGAHKKFQDAITARSAKEINSPEGIRRHFATLDDFPLAFCIIELVFDEQKKGIDFIFRYCNKEMEVIEGIPIEEMLDRSFYKVFQKADRKWLYVYSDVALNGTRCIVESFSPEVDKNLRIYCHQPSPGFCACALIDLNDLRQRDLPDENEDSGVMENLYRESK